VNARRVFGERPQRLGRDTNATSRPRREVDAHSKAVVRLGAVGSRGMGAHARARGLASQGRGVGVPCAGHRHTGPAARRVGGAATAAAGMTAARRVPARKDGTAAEGKWGSYGRLRKAPRHRRQQGKGKGMAAAARLTGEAGAEGAPGSGEARPAGRGRAGCAAASVSSYGRRRGDALGGVGVLLLELFSSSSSLGCGDGGRETGARVARVSGGGSGGSYTRRRGSSAAAAEAFWRPRRDTWRHRGAEGARLGLGFAAQAVALRCRGAETGGRGLQVTRGSGAAAGKEKRKREAGGWSFCRGVGRRGGGEREPGSRAVGRKGKADGWDPPVSCPGRMGREGAREFGKLGWADGVGPARVREKEREKGEKERVGLRTSWAGLWLLDRGGQEVKAWV
jgi:hypothetical protein